MPCKLHRQFVLESSNILHLLLQEIVPLRKICRRPETDHRLQQLHAMPVNMNPHKTAIEVQVAGNNTLKVDAAGNAMQKQPKQDERVDTSTTTSATPSAVPPPTETKLPPSKATGAGNATVDANTVAVSTAAGGDDGALPTLPQV